MHTNNNKEIKKSPYSGRLWESGQFSVGRVPPKLPKKEKEKTPTLSLDFCCTKYELMQTDREYLLANNVDVEHKVARIEDCFSLGYLNRVQRSILLGLVTAPISQIALDSARLRKGLNGITKHGRYMLENAVLRLSREVGMDRLTFGTVTFPPLPQKFLDIIVAGDYRLLEKEFRRRLTVHLASKSQKPVELVISVEIQEERFESSGYPYLHWHFVYVAKEYYGVVNDKNPYWLNIDEIDDIWSNVAKDWLHGRMRLMNISYADYEIDCLNFRPSCTLRKCHGLSPRYVAKYISKGSQCCQDVIEEGFEKMLPYHWWYITPTLKSRVLDLVVEIPEEVSKELFFHPEEMEEKGFIKKFFILEVTWNDEIYQVGVVGRMTNDGIDLVQRIFHQQDFSMLITT